MSAQAPLLVRIRPRWLQLRNQQALLLPGRSVGHISILSQTFNHIESTFRDPGLNVGIVAPTLGVAPASPGRLPTNASRPPLSTDPLPTVETGRFQAMKFKRIRYHRMFE